MPENDDRRKPQSCTCLAYGEEEDLSDAEKRFEEKNKPKEQLFKDIKLSDLANQFESVLDRVKELELHHLIEPIQSAVYKLRKLENLTANLACDYYNYYPGANCCMFKDCCNSISITKSAKKNLIDTSFIKFYCSDKESSDSDQSDDSCECCNAEGEISCHCGSDEDVGVSCRKDKKLSSLHKTETYCIEKGRSAVQSTVAEVGKCNPCQCMIDASGKRTKTLDCKLAAKARRKQRRGAEDEGCSPNECGGRPRTADAGCCRIKSTDDTLNDIVIQRTVSNSRIKVQANLTNLNVNVSKENTRIKDTTYVTLKGKNQEILCNLSNESSSEESDSTDSNGRTCCSATNNKGVKGNKLRSCNGSKRLNECSESEINSGACGCGRPIGEGAPPAMDESLTCPCGCGDMMDLPKERRCVRSCQCENCGKDINEKRPARDAKCCAEKPVPFNSTYSPRTSTCAPQKTCNELQHRSRESLLDQIPRRETCERPTDDLRSYIASLENKCRKKDKIIRELKQELMERTDSDSECREHPH